MKEGIYVEKIRKWDDAKTTVTVTKDSIGSWMSIKDFGKGLKAEIDLQGLADSLKAEIGSIAMTFKAETFNKQLDAAMKKSEKVFEDQLEEAIGRVIAQI